VIAEPLGGAHRDPQAMAQALQETLLEELAALDALGEEPRTQRRAARVRGFGVFKEGSV
jgi:acetyl-CoA carboxylase carboxyl transferase subunit alpha